MKNLTAPVFFSVMKIISIVVFILTILSSYGGHINPQDLATPSLLCLGMPYFALATVVLILFWAISRKFVFTAVGVIVILICIPSISTAIPFGYRREIKADTEPFKIISWNVLHTQDIRKPEYPGNRALEYMINSGADIICLAELRNFTPRELINASTSLIDSLNFAYPYKAGLNSTDIKVISKYPVERMNIGLIDEDGDHRFDFFKVHFPDFKTLIVAMVHLYSYGLNDEERNVVTEINSMKTAKESVKEFKGPIIGKLKEAFRRRASNATLLRNILDSIPEQQPLIVCGDFNDVPASWAYNIIRSDDLRDAYSETNFGPAITYNLHKFYFHIDQMLYRGDLEAIDLNIGKINSSDHYPLIGEFVFTNGQ